MPLLTIKTSVPVANEKKEELFKRATKMLVEAAGKNEANVMIYIEHCDGCMGGTIGPVAFAEIRSMVGLTHEVNNKISDRLCSLLNEMLGIPGENIYLNFVTVPETTWGWNHGIVVWDNPQKKWLIK
jgi:phenylpyruvate tautomerase